MRNPLLRALGICLSALATLGSAPALAALGPEVSEALAGQTVPEVEAETLDGRIFKLSEPRGAPVLVNFFASWCAVCQAEHKELRGIYTGYAARGLRFVGVLVDPVETPDTVAEARALLARDPLPYPVLLMDQSMGAAFHYTGFPATYFITSDGRFSTTLYGYQPREQITSVADRVLDATAGPGQTIRPAGVQGEGSGRRQSWDRAPLMALVPRGWKQWHPLVIHFPIAFLVLEALCVLACAIRPAESLDHFSRWLLSCAVLSLVPAIYTGVRDAGADLGPGWAFWNGLVDRVRHLFLLESTVSLHVLFALVTVVVAAGRFVWRFRGRERAFQGKQRLAFVVLTLVGVWTMYAAAQVGGSVSHP